MRENNVVSRERYETIRENIRVMATKRRRSQTQIAEYIGLSRATFYKRMERPELFTMRELTDMARLLNVDPETMIFTKL